LRPIDGIFRAAEMLGCKWQDVWPRFSEMPANLLGLKNELSVGQPANFCLLKDNNQNELVDLQVCTQGNFA
jgi:N-acetylglucosamine-6-phosphate deacetylase